MWIWHPWYVYVLLFTKALAIGYQIIRYMHALRNILMNVVLKRLDRQILILFDAILHCIPHMYDK